MSYRNYLYGIDNDELNKIKKMTLQKIMDDYSDGSKFIWLPDLLGESATIIFEYGKYSEFDEKIRKITMPLFEIEESHQYFNDEHQLVLVGREIFPMTIEIMRKKIEEMYRQYFKNPESAMAIFHDRIKEWKDFPPYVIDMSKNKISRGDHYEYCIFELIHIMKTFDYNKYSLVYMGY